ncbi:uncharacterized protein LOC108197445 isoform X2 [Daucus carota subsp. sativus]|uniref:uncharacterized protein LOC108197445 isoform X2 n=1 Tax=Daucus carota subsp. sativus TaxID=79200 RepID=UPI0007EF6F48|nr:PREDICTED: uncharacterized protein LOC108197445 isoform X2 [Daucus carota subsp. sativus]
MIMGGDFNLNSSQVYTDSFKEILRQTMLNHEVTFQKQVHELHRIYITQKTLMKDCYSRELNWLQSENAASTQLNRHPFSDQLGQEPHSTEKTHSTIFLGGSTQSFQRSATQEGGDFCHRLYQRPNFSTNCMSYTDTDILVAGCNQDFIGKSNERKNCFSEDGSCCPDEVKLSLSIGGSSKKKAARRNFLTDKNRCVSSQEIIDLEEPAEMSGYDNQPGFPIHDQVTSGPRKDSQSSSKFYQKINDITVKDPADSFSTPHSGIGLNERDDDRPGDSMFTKDKLLSNVALSLDLNKIQLDESSTRSNNSLLGYTSAGSSTGDAILGLRDPNGKNSANVSKTIFKSKGKDKNIPCSTDLESISKLLSCDQPSNHLLNIDTRINLHCGKIRDIAKFEENVRKLNEDVNLVPSNRSQSATGDTDCCRRSSPCDFDCVVNDTLDAARTMHSGTDLERGLSSSCLIQNAESSQVAENACQLDLSSSSISKTELQVRDKMKRESTDIDTFIQEAAASLISISLESRTENHHSPAKFRSDRINGDEADRNIMRDQPESSSDSYESMVMKLTETGADDYCVSSNPFEVHELCNKDTGIKLRRGRRLKDFRKDILPGMATLSRHEIREDINIMEGVLRSREYKRLRSKAGNTGNWFTPVKSRRSRRNHGGQKNYQ